MEDLLKEQILIAYALFDCMVYKTLAHVNISLEKFEELKSEDSYFSQKLKEVEELEKDAIEIRLKELAKEGELGAIKYYLDHKAKDRGYGKQLEIRNDFLPPPNIINGKEIE